MPAANGAQAGKRLFISYATEDVDWAQQLNILLANSGADFWMDETRIQGGDTLLSQITQALEAEDLVAVLLEREGPHQRMGPDRDGDGLDP